MNRARLAQRREQAIAAVVAGERVRDVAKRFGLTSSYVYVVVRRAGQQIPKQPKSGPLFSARRREAKVRELVALGMTYRRIAELLHINRQSAFIICQRIGIKAVRDKAGWQGAIELGRSRADVMAALYREGYTLQQVADQYGLTRERVRQLMTKHLGMTAKDGGAHRLHVDRLRGTKLDREHRYIKKYGCTVDQWQELRLVGKQMQAAGKGLYQTPLRAYSNHQNNAKRRGIGWELNLWQWWNIWQESGHWAQRGIHSGCYVMCRKGDKGPYGLGNVFIALSSENVHEGNSRKNNLPLGVRATKSGKYEAFRQIHGTKLRFGPFDTPALAHAAYLRAAPQQGVAA